MERHKIRNHPRLSQMQAAIDIPNVSYPMKRISNTKKKNEKLDTKVDSLVRNFLSQKKKKVENFTSRKGLNQKVKFVWKNARFKIQHRREIIFTFWIFLRVVLNVA